MPFIFLIMLLIALFLLSRQVTKLLSRLFMQLFHKQATAIYLLSFLFLPGVVLHELSHLLVANILFVPTGEVEFFPEIQGNEVKMGSVAIARTDPLRRFLIGVAPVLGGLGMLFVASSYLFDPLVSWKSAVLFYVIFQIGNTLFASGKDMEGATGFLGATVLLGVVLQILGIHVWQYIVFFVQGKIVSSVIARIDFFLLFAIGVDIFLVLLFEGLVRLRR